MRDGTWERVLDKFREMERVRNGKNPQPSAGIVDSQSVKFRRSKESVDTTFTDASR